MPEPVVKSGVIVKNLSPDNRLDEIAAFTVVTLMSGKKKLFVLSCLLFCACRTSPFIGNARVLPKSMLAEIVREGGVHIVSIGSGNDFVSFNSLGVVPNPLYVRPGSISLRIRFSDRGRYSTEDVLLVFSLNANDRALIVPHVGAFGWAPEVRIVRALNRDLVELLKNSSEPQYRLSFEDVPSSNFPNRDSVKKTVEKIFMHAGIKPALSPDYHDVLLLKIDIKGEALARKYASVSAGPAAAALQYTGARTFGKFLLVVGHKTAVVFFSGTVMPPRMTRLVHDRPDDAPFSEALAAPGGLIDSLLRHFTHAFGSRVAVAALKDADTSIVRSAAEVLGEIKDPETAAPLGETALFEDNEVGSAALNSLRLIGGMQALEFIIKVLEKNGKNSRQALEALQAVSGQDFGNNIDDWRNWLEKNKSK